MHIKCSTKKYEVTFLCLTTYQKYFLRADEFTTSVICILRSIE